MSAEQCDHNSTLDELEKLLNDEDFCQFLEIPRNDAACTYIKHRDGCMVFDVYLLFFFVSREYQ